MVMMVPTVPAHFKVPSVPPRHLFQVPHLAPPHSSFLAPPNTRLTEEEEEMGVRKQENFVALRMCQATMPLTLILVGVTSQHSRVVASRSPSAPLSSGLFFLLVLGGLRAPRLQVFCLSRNSRFEEAFERSQ
ncbi:hypothetical protein E2C01_077350 [Portunus trituberculatus]|uniref:Uncharacterized protein n=1 Tax=Portunus trituberculatus TaxID=210409 RepID=A0A5B7IB84_PORTR|nr:hypothetical protein [Portunus trituberculatus]